MRAQCLHCKKEYNVQDDAVGQTYECKNCGKKFFVPKPMIRICPDCGSHVSAKALWCPTCGRHSMHLLWTLVQIFFYLGIGGAILLIFIDR